MPHRTRFDPAILPVYGRLMDTRPHLQPGDTVTLPGNRSAAVVDICGDLVQVRTENGHRATIHVDLLESTEIRS